MRRVRIAAKRQMFIPTERMASPTHMSAAGVSLEVNTEMVLLSSEEFRGICAVAAKVQTCLSRRDVYKEADFLLCRRRESHHGNMKHEVC